MDQIFNSYVENAFGANQQHPCKAITFALNYQRFFPIDKNAKILDIGVGLGEMLTCMQQLGYHNYLGIDISPSTIAFCKKLQLNCMLVKNTIDFLKEYKNEFALITLLDVLEHIPKNETIAFLTAIFEALAPNGKVIIQVPNLQAPDGFLHRYNDITHEVGYIEHSLQQVLMAANFKNFEFYGLEEYCSKKFLNFIRIICRTIYWQWVRARRLITLNLNPKILHPVFYAVATKQK